MASGVKACEEIQPNFLRAYSKKDIALDSFIADRLQASIVPSFVPIPPINWAKFLFKHNLCKDKDSKTDVVLKADRANSARLLVVATNEIS